MEENKTIQQVQVAVPQMTKQEFLEILANKLGGYKWPDGAIECINPADAKLVYVWGNRFKGTAEGTWSAKVRGEVKIEVNKNEVNLADGTPYSGALPSINFDALVINDNEATPYWAKPFADIGLLCENFQPYSSVEAFGGTVEGSSEGNPLAAWVKNGNKITDSILLPAANTFAGNSALAYIALNIVPAEVIKQSIDMFNDATFPCRDVAVSSRNSVSEDPSPVLIPFYLLEFQFENKTYHVAISADICKVTKGHIPPVKNDDRKTPEQIVAEEMPDKVKQAKILKWGWVLAILLLFSAGFKIAFVYLIVWGAGYWFFNKKIKDRIKELENLAAGDQLLIAEQLKKQLLK